MDNDNAKEKLEQELRFLKESFDAEVISKEEFEKGSDRIEKKLNEIGSPVNEQNDKQESENSKTEESEKKPDGKIKLNVIQDGEDGEYFERNPKEQTEKIQVYNEKKESKFFKYAVVFVVLALVAFFSYSLINSDKNTQAKASDPKTNEIKFAAVCSSDKECNMEGKTGICINPGAKNAGCEFIWETKTNMIVLNGRHECFNCDTRRVLGILEGWFGPINSNEIDYSTDNGKNLAEKLGVNSLPAYVLDNNITKNPAFEQFNPTFLKKGDYYVLSEDAAGSTFYFRRENIPNRLDFFVRIGDKASLKAENNLKEFIDNFKDVKFEKHFSNDKFTGEIGISSFPSFLVNNRIKFSGTQPAETIKENFCKLILMWLFIY